jgi:Ca2+-binding RTX toxin-like protein
MVATPFTGAVPSRQIWVSPNGRDGNSGSADAPMRTIQAAVDKAGPGTAVMVKAGRYVENVEFQGVQGTSQKPVWLISADGPEKAVIKAASNGRSTVYAHGEDNIVIEGFRIEGGKNGIQFSQSGSNFKDLAQNIVVKGNTIVGAQADGVKISQADNVHIIDNRINGAGDQGIDFVAVNDSVIARNEVAGITGSSGAIFAKGGSTRVEIIDNHVKSAKADGIVIGGWTEGAYFRPGTHGWEARDVTVTGNLVEGVGQRPLNVLGGQDVTVTGNHFKANPGYAAAVNVGPGSPYLSKRPVSKNVEIVDNIISNAKKLLIVEPGNNNNVNFTRNGPDGSWDRKTGPGASEAASGKPVPAQEAAAPAPDDAGDVPAAGILEGVTIPEGWALGGGIQAVREGSSADERLAGTERNDEMIGHGGQDVLAGGKGDDLYIVSRGVTVEEKADEGVDTIHLWTRHYPQLGENIENVVIRLPEDVTIRGNALDNVIVGGKGNDTIDGGAGADALAGGEGDDTFVVRKGEGDDTILDLGAGDRVRLEGFGFEDFEALKGSMTAEADGTRIDLGDGQSLRLAQVAPDALDAARFVLADGEVPVTADGETPDADAPAAETPAGTSELIAMADGPLDAQSQVEPILLQTAGGRELPVPAQHLSVLTDAGVVITGNTLDNRIAGGGGDDRIIGGEGADHLTGGAGRDVFVYGDLTHGGDLITDFRPGEDRLDLNGLLADLDGATTAFAARDGGTAVVVSSGGTQHDIALLAGLQPDELTPGTDLAA